MSSPPCARSCGSSRCGRGGGSPSGRANAVVRNGASASAVTTQGEIVVAKFLPRNGPSGWDSQLNVARGPIIEQAIAENIICRFADRHAAAQVGRGADECAEFEFKIETLRRAEAWRAVRVFALAVRPRHGEIADPHGGGTAVIGDRQIFVVRRQRIIRAKQPSGIGGVEDRSKEVGEITEDDRYPHL